jgi:hypothetical protein
MNIAATHSDPSWRSDFFQRIHRENAGQDRAAALDELYELASSIDGWLFEPPVEASDLQDLMRSLRSWADAVAETIKLLENGGGQ